MRVWLIGAAGAAALLALPATAQTRTDLSGTWAFHTADYAPSPPLTLRMSGVAVMRRARGGVGRYEIDLFTQEVAARGQQFREIWSRQRCVGRSEEDRLTITCTMVDSDQEGYQPDNFQLSRQADGALTGHLVSSNSSAVVFRRVP